MSVIARALMRRRCALLAPLLLSTLLLPPEAFGETQPADPNDRTAPAAPETEEQATGAQFAPLTTGLTLNNTRIDHRTRWDLSVGTVRGDARNDTPSLRGTVRLGQKLEERLEGRVYVREQSAWYAQAATFNRIRDVTLTQTTPVTVIGAHIQLSITGTCALPGTPPDAHCTYTPGFSVDQSSIDPDLLVPTRFNSDSSFSAVVTPETLAAMRQPGWQRGAPGGQLIGLDLDFPNSGYFADEARRGRSSVTRREEVEIGQVFALSRVKQHLKTNDTRATLARTVRGLALPVEHDWSDRAVAWQLLAWLLPEMKPDVRSGTRAPNTSLNNNLFLAANNARLPRDSYTLFYSGISRVLHPKGAIKRLQDIPAAHFVGVWLGLSPIIDRVQTNRIALKTLGPRETLESTFAQGGGDGEVVDVSVLTVIDGPDGSQSINDFRFLQDPFIQVGLEVTEQSADLTASSQLVETTRYVPHLSFTGNRTSSEQVLRYYVGLMEGEDTRETALNAYAGLDWTYNSQSGWRIRLGGIGYSDANYDYFSEVSGHVHRIFQAPWKTKVALGVSAAYALDRPGDFQGFVLDYDASRLDLSAEAQRGKWNLTLTQGINEVLPDSRAPSTTFRLGYQPTPKVKLSGVLTPYSEQTSYLQGQLGLSWKLSERGVQPTLRAQWSRIQYDYGEDGFGDALGITEDVVSLSLQMRFDGPAG